jgi:hypothetical protein
MRKSATLIRKHYTPSRLSLTLLVFAGLLLSSRAATQTTLPFRFVSQASPQAEVTKEVPSSPEAVKEHGDEVPFSVSVSPSATTGKFLVSIKGNPEDRVRVKVTDKHGCVIDKHEVPGQSNLQLGFWYFPGTYQLHVTGGGTTKTVKLEKLREKDL